MIENVGQCEKIKKITRYPTQGGSRGLGLVRQNQWGSDSKLIKKEPIVIAQIESLDGVKNLDDIKKSKTFNYYMIGPYDLSSSLGVPGDFNSDVYLNTVDKIKSVIRNQEMAVHIPCDIEKQLKKYENYSIIALGMDTTFLVEKIREVFEC
jgi:2-dehydro-3-deoxyglucarate aldolase